VCRKKKLFTKKGRVELEGLRLGVWASYRRQELLTMLDGFDGSLGELDRAVAEQAEQNAAGVLLMTHPGVGPVTSLAFVLTLGPVERFERSKQIVSYLGLNPREHSAEVTCIDKTHSGRRRASENGIGPVAFLVPARSILPVLWPRPFPFTFLRLYVVTLLYSHFCHDDMFPRENIAPN
jgi:Transposase IS116/IS110/IS902 family